MQGLRHTIRRLTCTLVTASLVLCQAAPATAYATDTVDKSETVHVQTDPTGTVTSITVDELLANDAASPTVSDRSTLTDITPTSDDQTFKRADGDTLVWTTNGEQVSYQGTSSATPPVQVKVSYELDGKAIQPSKLAGASGHLVMRVDYVLSDEAAADVQMARTPFACMTVIMLDGRLFSNVTAINGKVIDDKGGLAVVGLALPTMREALDLDSTDLGLDVDFPEYLEVSADVHDLELDPIYTVVTPELLSDLDTSELDLGLDDLDEGTAALEDAMSALIEGSCSLTDALGQLAAGGEGLSQGADALREALDALPEGLSGLSTGAHGLKDGLSTAADSADALATGANGLSDGAEGATTAISGAQEAVTAAQGAVDGLDTALDGLKGAPKVMEEASGVIEDASEAASRASSQLTEAGEALLEGKEPIGASLADAGSSLEAATTGVSDASSALDEAIATLGSLDPEGLTDEQLQALELVEGLMTDASGSLAGATEGIAASQTHVNEATVGLDGLDVTLPEGIQDDIAALDADAASLAESALGIPDPTEALGAAAGLSAALEGATKGLDAVSTALSGISAGAEQLGGGAEALSEALVQASDGAGQLAGGIDEMAGAAPQLVSGASQLSDGATQLSQGLRAAADGSASLTDGLSTLQSKGIRELTHTLRGMGSDVDALRGRLDGMRDASKAYDSFAGKAPDQSGTVRFIYKTEQIG